MGDMESIYTKLALYGSKHFCATTDNVFFPISEVCDGTVSLIKTRGVSPVGDRPSSCLLNSLARFTKVPNPQIPQHQKFLIIQAFFFFIYFGFRMHPWREHFVKVSASGQEVNYNPVCRTAPSARALLPEWECPHSVRAGNCDGAMWAVP